MLPKIHARSLVSTVATNTATTTVNTSYGPPSSDHSWDIDPLANMWGHSDAQSNTVFIPPEVMQHFRNRQQAVGIDPNSPSSTVGGGGNFNGVTVKTSPLIPPGVTYVVQSPGSTFKSPLLTDSYTYEDRLRQNWILENTITADRISDPMKHDLSLRESARFEQRKILQDLNLRAMPNSIGLEELVQQLETLGISIKQGIPVPNPAPPLPEPVKIEPNPQLELF